MKLKKLLVLLVVLVTVLGSLSIGNNWFVTEVKAEVVKSILTNGDADSILTDGDAAPGNDIVVNTDGVKTESELTDAMNTAINSASNGDVVKVEVPTEVTKIEKNVFETASQKGVSVVVAIDPLVNTNSDYVKWSFNTVNNSVDFVPTVKVDADVEAINAVLESVTLPQTLKSTSVSFDHTGNLPGEAKVTLDIGSSSLNGSAVPGDTVYLYFYNPANNLFELISEAVVENYGFATFTMTHCSDYIIVTEKLPAEIVSANTSAGNTVTPVAPTTPVVPTAPVTPAPATPVTPAAPTDVPSDNVEVASPKTGDEGVQWISYIGVLISGLGIAVVMKKRARAK